MVDNSFPTGVSGLRKNTLQIKIMNTNRHTVSINITYNVIWNNTFFEGSAFCQDTINRVIVSRIEKYYFLFRKSDWRIGFEKMSKSIRAFRMKSDWRIGFEKMSKSIRAFRMFLKNFVTLVMLYSIFCIIAG